MNHNGRTAAQRRRLAVGLGTAAGALLATALIPITIAHADDTDADPFTDLGLVGGAKADALLLTFPGGAVAATGLDKLVDDGQLSVPPSDLDPFEDAFGNNAATAFLDSLSPPIIATQLDPLVDMLAGTGAGSAAATASAAVTAADADPFEDLGLVGGAKADEVLLALGDGKAATQLDALVDSGALSLPPDLDPFEDVFGNSAATAFLDSLLPPIVASQLDPLADMMVAAGL